MSDLWDVLVAVCVVYTVGDVVCVCWRRVRERMGRC